MNMQDDILRGLRNDEIVSFLAVRYHTSPERVLQSFLVQEGYVAGGAVSVLRLEKNETAMLRGLMQGLEHTADR